MSVLDLSSGGSRPGEVGLLDKGIVETLNRLLVCAYILVVDAEVVVDSVETRVVTNRCLLHEITFSFPPSSTRSTSGWYIDTTRFTLSAQRLENE